MPLPRPAELNTLSTIGGTMKIITSFAILMSIPLLVFADTEWRTAKVYEIGVGEIFPVIYNVSYERRCNDIEEKHIKFTTDSTTVIGVLVKNDPEDDCWKEEPISELDRVIFSGDEHDPQKIEIIK